jgi:hypothetical protein
VFCAVGVCVGFEVGVSVGYGLTRQLMIPQIALSALFAPYRAKLGMATGFLSPTTGRRGDAGGPARHPPPGPPPLRRLRAPSERLAIALLPGCPPPAP